MEDSELIEDRKPININLITIYKVHSIKQIISIKDIIKKISFNEGFKATHAQPELLSPALNPWTGAAGLHPPLRMKYEVE